MDDRQWTLGGLAAGLAAGRITAAALVEACLDRIAAPAGEGARTFLAVDSEAVRHAARAADRARKQGHAHGCAGIPVSVKDLFDVAGQVTTAGSTLLAGAAPARADAAAVARLRARGFILIGRTNMTEFAFSGVGLNPHYGTPLNPWDRAAARIPGGSSSGAAVSVTDAMAHAGLGTDTGGSCRIPAALCGLVGFKPTARRVPRDGVHPLSTTLDSVGPLARSVDCCARLDAALAGIPEAPLPRVALRGVTLGVPGTLVLDGLDVHVGAAFERALSRLARAGARLVEATFPELNEPADINRQGGCAAAEAWEHHRARIAASASAYDPRVLVRMLPGRDQSAADYIELIRRRADLIRRVTPALRARDAWLMPTVPIVAPLLTALAADADYARFNSLLLRNPSLVNFLDGCAVTIPVHEPGSAPVGLTLFQAAEQDRRLLALAAAVEECLGS